MRAGMLTGVRSVEILDIPNVEVQGSHEVVIRVSYVGLCGTDLELYNGTSNYLRQGKTKYPHNFGHEWVGTVETPPSGAAERFYLHQGAIVTGSTMIPCLTCDACRSGRRNLCRHVREIGLYDYAGAVAERIVVPAHVLTVVDGAVNAVPRPEHVLVEPLATVLGGVAEAQIKPGDRVLVMGGGTIGSLAALVLKQYSVDVEVLDPIHKPHLLGLGIQAFTDLNSNSFHTYDMVYECSGSTSATQNIQTVLKTGGAAVLIGVPPEDTRVNISELALRGQRLIGVRHGVDQYPAAKRFIMKHQVEMQALIDRVFKFDDVKGAFPRLEKERNHPKVVIKID